MDMFLAVRVTDFGKLTITAYNDPFPERGEVFRGELGRLRAWLEESECRLSRSAKAAIDGALDRVKGLRVGESITVTFDSNSRVSGYSTPLGPRERFAVDGSGSP